MRFFVEGAFPHLGKRGAASWKSAFCYLRLTEKRTLPPAPHGKAHSAIPRSRRLRLSVTSRRPGGVGQPPARLRGTMENGSTGQMRSSNPPPACGAACVRVRRSRFGVWPHGKAHSAQPVGFRLRLSVTSWRPGCGATPRQAAGRLAPSSRNGDDHVCDRPRPSCASTRPLKSCGLVQTTAMRVQTPTREVPFSIAR